ncbi:MAG: hypothetical protein KIT59_01145 [Nitrosomonas sp.]|nr:hypothetical protein [Nitrosomonas sp.]
MNSSGEYYSLYHPGAPTTALWAIVLLGVDGFVILPVNERVMLNKPAIISSKISNHYRKKIYFIIFR